MIHSQRRAIAAAIALLAAVAVLIPAAPLRAAAPLRQIPVTVATTLAPNRAYSFKFSLHTAAATSVTNRVWGPVTATLKVAADKTITYTLGVKPRFATTFDMSQQLWLQVTGGGKTVRVPLGAAPYALWSPASDIPGPRGEPGADGLACWDTNGNGACDGDEDRVGGDGCNVADCRGDSFTLTCQDGESIVWSAAAGQWQCGPALVGSPTAYYLDADHDGFGASACYTPLQGDCTATEAGDANDANCLINPDMVWFLNSRSTTNPLWCLNGDTNPACDIYFKSLGAGGTTMTAWVDRDGDGFFSNSAEIVPIWFGNCLASATAAPDPAPSLRGDCDNLDPSIKPGAAEICDGIDQDCDGQIDEGVCL